MTPEQISNKSGDHKHSANFTIRDYEAFTCRIVGQKVQRVPALMGDKGGNRCLFVDNLVHRPLTSRGHCQRIQLPLRQKMSKKILPKKGAFHRFLGVGERASESFRFERKFWHFEVHEERFFSRQIRTCQHNCEYIIMWERWMGLVSTYV